MEPRTQEIGFAVFVGSSVFAIPHFVVWIRICRGVFPEHRLQQKGLHIADHPGNEQQRGGIGQHQQNPGGQQKGETKEDVEMLSDYNHQKTHKRPALMIKPGDRGVDEGEGQRAQNGQPHQSVKANIRAALRRR